MIQRLKIKEVIRFPPVINFLKNLNLSLLSKWFKQAFESIDEFTEILDESLLETDLIY